MATKRVGTNVIPLDCRTSIRERSEAMRAAMRRHPSFQGFAPAHLDDAEAAVVLTLRPR